MCQGGCLLGRKQQQSNVYSYIYIYTDHTECCNITYFGWSSLGFMFGSSLPFPAGLSCISFSSTISSVISTLPCEIFKHINNHKKPQIHKKYTACWEKLLTPSTRFPSCSFTHGHQPRTAFWEKSELGSGFFKEDEFGIPGSIFRLHFSGLLAGGIRLRRSNSTEPLGVIKLKKYSWFEISHFIL